MYIQTYQYTYTYREGVVILIENTCEFVCSSIFGSISVYKYNSEHIWMDNFFWACYWM